MAVSPIGAASPTSVASTGPRSERKVIDISEMIQGKEKVAKKFFVLLIAAAVVTIASLILAVTLGFWVALPVFTIGVALGGLSWYFFNQWTRIENDIDKISQPTITVFRPSFY